MMKFETLEPAYHPKNKMGFLIDWLVTLKCNYDCAYCDLSGHDNSTRHPPLEKCLIMLKQMYQYADVIMSHKKKPFKDVTMNIYGGESIYHPDILKIIQQTSEMYRPYEGNWRLRRRITTNGTAVEKNWKEICRHIEGFTMSYHSTGPEKLKKLFYDNLLYLVKIEKEHDIVVCMYPTKEHWKDCVNFLRWAKENGLRARPKILDGPLGIYQKHHIEELKEFIKESELQDWDVTKKADHQARGCCGGRQMCFNRNLKEHNFLVPRKDDGFKGWHCSANQFFLHGNNVSGLYFTNKDCRVRLDGKTGPIANLHTMDTYIKNMEKQQVLPTLVCAQTECICGTCAPKSVHKKNLDDIVGIYNKTTVADNV